MAQVTDITLVQAFEKLFISSKQKRIEQQSDGSYYVKHNGLARSHLISHLQGTKTIGIFSGDVYSKYLCFDIDTGSYSKAQARNDVRVLVWSLISEFDISKEYITVADSGNKGYHVYLFFDDVIHVEYLRAFYREVLERTGYSTSDIEFRPTATQGVKLPLGIHQKTSKRCYFVDYFSPKFKALNNNNIHNIKQLDTVRFKTKNNLKDLYEIQAEEIYHQLCKFLTKDEARTFTGVVNMLDLTEKQIEHAETDIIKMLQDKTLIYPDTRNKYTLLIAIYLKGQGNEPYYVEQIINEIMLNSKRNYNRLVSSSERHIERETKKIVKYVFNTSIGLKNGNTTIELYADEIKDVLALKNMRLMQLYLSMLIHAKRHQPIGSNSFYMAYSTMADYGNPANRSTLRKYIHQLEELGRIGVVASNVIDPIRSEVEGYSYKKPNVYHIKKSFNQNSRQKVLVKADVTSVNINDILIKAYRDNVIGIDEIKQLPRRQFDKFKQSL
ncbi:MULTISPECIES: TOTE conflict system archaeo-eukaryotic primase domain-containing protein [Staphylococcus]|uniref:TOTE conflict system archaeo-eukaryotic primase domain-containing protein n=1 Tax=Staphylococcus TaxID=1279 RepID=UPI001AEBED57|nr:hypothetical protein [Staphylococcus sp. GDY8P196P]